MFVSFPCKNTNIMLTPFLGRMRSLNTYSPHMEGPGNNGQSIEPRPLIARPLPSQGLAMAMCPRWFIEEESGVFVAQWFYIIRHTLGLGMYYYIYIYIWQREFFICAFSTLRVRWLRPLTKEPSTSVPGFQWHGSSPCGSCSLPVAVSDRRGPESGRKPPNHQPVTFNETNQGFSKWLPKMIWSIFSLLCPNWVRSNKNQSF